MSEDACTQFAPQLKPEGLVLFEEELVHTNGKVPATARTLGIPATRFAEELGRRLVLNIVMVGFFAGATGLLPFEAVEKAVLDSVPRGTESLNLRAFTKGYEFGQSRLA
jgi:2-oxoglutarate ferredoxin oxidoreductase subunit gamma